MAGRRVPIMCRSGGRMVCWHTLCTPGHTLTAALAPDRYLLYDVAAFSGSTVCAKSAYNLAGVPSMLLDGPLPRTMTDFDRWAPGRPGGGADGMVQASSGSGSGSRASTLGDLLSPLMSARSGEWDTRAAVVGGGVQPVAQVDSRA